MQQRMKSAEGKKIQQNSQEIEVIEEEVRRMLKGLWPIKFQSIFLIFILFLCAHFFTPLLFQAHGLVRFFISFITRFCFVYFGFIWHSI